MNDTEEFIKEYGYDYVCKFYSSIVAKTIDQGLSIGMPIEGAIGRTGYELDAYNMGEANVSSDDYFVHIVFIIELIIALLNKKEYTYAKNEISKLLTEFNKYDLNEFSTVLKELNIKETAIVIMIDRIQIILKLI